MKYELEIISDITDTTGPKPKIIKRQDKIKRLFELNELEVEEYVEPKTGKHIAKYSGIYYKDIYYKVNKPYEELKQLVNNRTTPVLGFAAKSKRYK